MYFQYLFSQSKIQRTSLVNNQQPTKLTIAGLTSPQVLVDI